MAINFRIPTEIASDVQPWGSSKWLAGPLATESRDIAALLATISPGRGHDFHLHEGQEELILVLEGSIEQWLETERRILSAGDSVFVPAGRVHASFNAGATDARIAAIFGPCVGEAGLAMVDVSTAAPWAGMRRAAMVA